MKMMRLSLTRSMSATVAIRLAVPCLEKAGRISVERSRAVQRFPVLEEILF